MLVLKRTTNRWESPMQCTSPRPICTSSSEAMSARPVRLMISPRALLAAFATVPDPRRRQGIRFALAAILALAAAAILSNHLSVLAIAEWGGDQDPDLLRALGFPDGITPVQSTIQRLFRKLDPDRLSAALTE